MSKYAPLGDFLRRQKTASVAMTFAEIERVVGSSLPNSQRYPAWWSNNPHNNVMTQVWLDAGFVTEQVDVSRRKLVFRRAEPIPSAMKTVTTEDVARTGEAPDHPLFGWMKGSVHVPEGVDLTEAADPEWGANLDR